MKIQQGQLYFYGLLLMMSHMWKSCTDPIDLNLPENKPTMVLNSLLNTDSITYARLTWLNNPSSLTPGYFHEIPDATIVLHENDVAIEQLTTVEIKRKIYYKGNYVLRNAQTYRLVATAKNGTQVFGQAVTLAPPSFSVGPARWVNSPSNAGNRETQVSLFLDDPAGQKNFYRIRLASTQASPVMRWYEHISWIGPGKQDANFFMDDFSNKGIFIDDVLFDGKKTEIIIRCENILQGPLILQVTALTRESFHYLRNAAFAEDVVDNFLVEPIPVLSNITNGYGFVGGVALLEKSIEISGKE